jgi:hypothetical protein
MPTNLSTIIPPYSKMNRKRDSENFNSINTQNLFKFKKQKTSKKRISETVS